MYLPARAPRKAPWVLALNRLPAVKKRNRIPAMSKHRHARYQEYKKVVACLKKRYPRCQVAGCSRPSKDPHHTRGRVSTLLTDERFLKMVCRECHNRIGDDPIWARSAGMLCEHGKWNAPEK